MPRSSGVLMKAFFTGTALIILLGLTWVKNHPRNSSSTSAELPAVSGSYDLQRDEQLGGHTLRRHVGRTDDQLRDRLQRERDISAASTYTDRAAAERTVAAALGQNQQRVNGWLNRTDAHPNLALHFRGNAPIGRCIRQRAEIAEPCSNAAIVLRWDGDQRFHVLTTYPEPNRGR
ncbi:MAG: RNase A-like domain-containing protein [Chthoniobacterales bacterium]